MFHDFGESYIIKNDTFSQGFLGGGLTDEEESHKIMDRYVELGGNFLDTANTYGNGQSEKYIGSWLKK